MIYLKPNKPEKLFDRWVYRNLEAYGNTIILYDTLDRLEISLEEAKRDLERNINLKHGQFIYFRESFVENCNSKRVKEHFVVEVME